MSHPRGSLPGVLEAARRGGRAFLAHLGELRRQPDREMPRPCKAALTVAVVLLATCVRAGPPPSRPTPIGTPVQVPVEPPAGAQGGKTPVRLPAPLPETPREFRGVWVATVGNMDWPSRPGLSTERQKAELLAILDTAAALHLNAVVFQVRPAADALYESPIEPWSRFLTGRMGKAPDPLWDPLRFAITEAHKRGLELHAWFNPYRAGFVGSSWHPSADHVMRKHPEMVVRYGSYYWMDPGLAEVRDYTLRVVLDVVNRYDVDGVQIDDYFYPYLEPDRHGRNLPFPDEKSWKAYERSGGTLSRGDWRRQNVNLLVRDLYWEIKQAKPWVKFGISPFGIWKSGTPASVRGLDAYSEIFADSRKWLENGWVDYFAPQLYWKTDAAHQGYATLLRWWESQNDHHRHLWPGNFTSRAGARGSSGWRAEEIARQIRITRDEAGATGNIHFSATALMTNSGGIDDELHQLYRGPALVPASPWLGDAVPPAPRLSLHRDGDAYVLDVAPGAPPAVFAVSTDGDGGSADGAGRGAGYDTPRFWLVRIHDATGWTTQVVSGEDQRLVLTGGYQEPVYAAVSGISRTGTEGAVAVAASAGAAAETAGK